MSAAYATRTCVGRHALLAHPSAPGAVELGQAAVDGVEVGHVGARLQRARVVVLDGGGQEAEGREHARRVGHEHLGHAELGGERRAVHRPGAAERHQRELPRVVAALDRDQSDLRRPCAR